jgi:4-amino-4-deoxy-L-arabinose transferase-like glycosyltransferase
MFIVAVAFAVRLISIPVVHSWPPGPDSPLWKTGPEIVNIAQALASHNGFSSPFGVATGPTAWIPPVYPCLLGLIFLVFGTKTASSAVLILTMQALFSALVCLPVYGIGKSAFGHRIAVSSAWIWALFPYSVLLPVLFIWETTLSALLLTWLVYMSMRLGFLSSTSRAGVGALWGMAALTNTALLVLLPVSIVSQLAPPVQRSRRVLMWVPVLLACLVTVTPWVWRNWEVLHSLVPVRSNFAEELWLGNHPGGSGRIAYGLNPSESRQELQNYESMGEIQYLATKQHEAKDFISSHRAEFVRLTLYRIKYWWYAKGESARIFIFYIVLSVLSLCGITLAFIGRNSGTRFIAICVLVYPVVYYLTDVYARYRYPIEPLMTLLTTFFLIEVCDVGRSLSRRAS